MLRYISASFLLLIAQVTVAQKVLSEGTVRYDITVQTGSKEPQLADMFDGATTTVYLKGSMGRTEMLSPLGSTITIHDTKANTGVILKEYGNQKLLIHMERSDWGDFNKKYEGITFNITKETKTIAGYKCEKAIAKLKDGSSFIVYFSREVVPENKEFDYQFRGLPGLPLEYESSIGTLKVKYTASRVSFDPVPAQKFAIPSSGYRELTYNESKDMKTN